MQSTRLKRVVKYLAANGMYKEAAQIKKIAESDSQSQYDGLRSHLKALKHKSETGTTMDQWRWDMAMSDLISAGFGGAQDMRRGVPKVTIEQWQDLCREFDVYDPEMAEVTEFDDETNMFGNDEDPDTGVGEAWHNEGNDDDE